MRQVLGSLMPASAVFFLLLFALPAQCATCSIRSTPLSPGDIALSHNDFAKAVALYDQERKAPGPEGERAHAAMIRALLRQQKISDAEKDALTWSRAQPNNAWSLVALDEVQWREGLDTQAYATIQKAHALDVCNPQVYVDLAAIFHLSGMNGSANQYLTLARKLDPVDDEIEGDWTSLQSRSVQLAQITNYLNRASYLSDRERKSLERRKTRLSRPPASPCHLASPVASTSIPFRAIRNGPEARTNWGLKVSFDGKERQLEIDTGASGLVLTKSAANALHLVPEAKFKIGGFGDEGAVSSFIAKVKSIKIGSLEFKDCDVQVLGNDAEGMASDGLIGGDVFANFLLTLDFPGRVLNLAPLPPKPGQPADANSQSLQTGVSADQGAPQNRYIAPSMKNWTKIYRSGHLLILRVQMNRGPWKLFVVDSGAALDLISPEAAREVAKVSNGSNLEIYGIAGQVNKTYTTGPLTLTFAGLRYPTPAMTGADLSRFGRSAGVEISGFMGAPILHQLTVSIDYRDDLMNFKYDPKRIAHCIEGANIADCY